MGDFSRDPNVRLLDSVAKHYVGVRLQQGVPILDTDWNELEDLRRHDVASLFTAYIGDGVPGDNDGFRVEALEGGGVGSIVLTAAGSPSSLAVDPAASTAMTVLGFLPGTVEGQPARLQTTRAQPFQLDAGATLTVVLDGVPQTVTFTGAAAASAADVVAEVNAALGGVVAAVGTGDDFVIRGGDGTVAGAGRLLARGRELIIESSMLYTSQRLFANAPLALAWEVPAVEPLTAPAVDDRVDTVYVDVWDREVSSAEDDAFLLPAVGVESSVRLRREWAVRVVENANDLSTITRLPHHTYVPIAQLRRTVADGGALPAGSVIDLRKRQLTLSDAVISPMLVKGEFNLDRVNSALFATMLRSTSRVYGELLSSDFFLANAFSNITAVESVVALRAFQDVRFMAESGITETSLRRFDNDAALVFLRRLYDVQRAFIDTLMPLADDGTVQRLPTRDLLQEMEEWLEGDGGAISGLQPALLPVTAADLGNAYDAQIFINSQIGLRTGVLPQGLLDIQFVSGPAVTINAGTVHTFVYSITSVLNADDTLVLAISDTLGVYDFAFQGLPPDPGNPGDATRALLELGQSDTEFVTFELIVPAAVPNGTRSRLVLTAVSQTNPDEIDFAHVAIAVEVGAAIQPPSAEVGLALLAPAINLATDVVPVGRVSDAAQVNFDLQLTNDGAAAADFQLSVEIVGETLSYEVVNPGVLAAATINAGASEFPTLTVQATATATAGEGESLLIIRLTRTGDGAFQELHIRVTPDVA
jgi:hypothetical protein